MRPMGQDEITPFFRQVVVAVNDAIAAMNLEEPAAWELARTLHSLWREALRRAHSKPRPSEHLPKGHPAMEELLQMIDVEKPE